MVVYVRYTRRGAQSTQIKKARVRSRMDGHSTFEAIASRDLDAWMDHSRRSLWRASTELNFTTLLSCLRNRCLKIPPLTSSCVRAGCGQCYSQQGPPRASRGAVGPRYPPAGRA